MSLRCIGEKQGVSPGERRRRHSTLKQHGQTKHRSIPHAANLDLLVVSCSYLPVGGKVSGRDLQRDVELRLFAHLLRQVVGLAHQRVRLHHLHLQVRQTLLEQLLPEIYTILQLVIKFDD